MVHSVTMMKLATTEPRPKSANFTMLRGISDAKNVNTWMLRSFRRAFTFGSEGLISIGVRRFVGEAAALRTTGRRTPTTMKLNTPEFHALFTPELRKLHHLFKKNNFELRMAGGAVRDLLMGIRPADVDFASDATPDQMKEMFIREGIRMLNKNGEEHGTVTCRIDDKENFEVTTLRNDVVCDGRRAKVEFTKDWELDAGRRDLTINSLFLDLDGTVIDYYDGIRDVETRRVVFVGDPVKRIQEDYLRILRYFRFFGRISPSNSVHDKACMDAIIANKDGLANISGERIWSELKKICVGRLADDVVRVMLEECSLGARLALPSKAPVHLFSKVFRYNSARKIQPITVLSSLFADQNDIEIFHKRCKLSTLEKLLAEFIISRRDEAEKEAKSLKYFKDMMLDQERSPNIDRKKLSGRERVTELAKYACAEDSIVNELNAWEMPPFPVSGHDLLACGASAGPSMRLILTYLFDVWKKSDWTLRKEELLAHVDEALEEVNKGRKPEGGKRKREKSS